MQFVAEAVEHKHPEVLADLLALFDAIIPPTPTRKQEDEQAGFTSIPPTIPLY